MREVEVSKSAIASAHAVLSSQFNKIVKHKVTNVTYQCHQKLGKPDSMVVAYFNGVQIVGREWVCFEHTGWAAEKACNWWRKRNAVNSMIPRTVSEAIANASVLRTPTEIAMDLSKDHPSIVGYSWE